MTDETLPIARQRDGGDPLVALYEREWPVLVRIAYLLVGRQEVAEELAQDAFVRLQTTATHVEKPGAYLRTSVVNACRSWHRHQGVVARSPRQRAEVAIDAHEELTDALARLPWRQRAALVLRFHLDLSEANIAAILDCRSVTVRSINRRALAALRKELS